MDQNDAIKALESQGFEVLYFWNNQWKVMHNGVDGRGNSPVDAFKDWLRTARLMIATLEVLELGGSMQSAADAGHEAAAAMDALIARLPPDLDLTALDNEEADNED
jgi:hypothetical protein